MSTLTFSQTDEFQEPLEKRLESAQERISSLESDLKKKTQLSTDLQHCAGVRQHDYEKLRKEHGDLRITYAQTSTELARNTQALHDSKVKNENLISARSALEKQVKELQESLLNHPNPAIAAAARHDAQQRALEAENAALRKSNASIKTDFSFTREQYQHASTRATEMAAEIEPLREENADLRRKLEADLALYRKLRDDDVTKNLRKEVQGLKITVKQRDAHTAKLESDLLELKRGRAGVQTRGSSVQPKSPRGASRGASPAPGFLGGHGMVRGGSGLSKFNG